MSTPISIDIRWTMNEVWLEEVARQLQKETGDRFLVKNGMLELHSKTGSGYLIQQTIEKGISLTYWNCEFFFPVQFVHPADASVAYYSILLNFSDGYQSIITDHKETMIGIRQPLSAYFCTSESSTIVSMPLQQPIRAIHLLIDKEVFNTLFNTDPGASGCVPSWPCFKGFTSISKDLLVSLLRLTEKEDTPEATKLFLKGKVFHFLSLFFNHLPDKKNQEKYSLGDIKKLIDISNAIARDYSCELPDINQIAIQLNISPTKFKQLFKYVYDDTYYSYFLNQRLLDAKELLSQKKTVSMHEIATRTGYSSVSHFSRAFKKKFHISPLNYHEEYLQTVNS
jgi:AraC-like DNA-binding protein